MRGFVVSFRFPTLIPSIFRVGTGILIGDHVGGIVLIDMYFFLKNLFLFPITSLATSDLVNPSFTFNKDFSE